MPRSATSRSSPDGSFMRDLRAAAPPMTLSYRSRDRASGIARPPRGRPAGQRMIELSSKIGSRIASTITQHDRRPWRGSAAARAARERRDPALELARLLARGALEHLAEPAGRLAARDQVHHQRREELRRAERARERRAFAHAPRRLVHRVAHREVRDHPGAGLAARRAAARRLPMRIASVSAKRAALSPRYSRPTSGSRSSERCHAPRVAGSRERDRAATTAAPASAISTRPPSRAGSRDSAISARVSNGSAG